MTLSGDERNMLVVLSVVTSAISFIASMSVVVTIVMGQYGYCKGVLRGVKVERLSFHLIAMVSISDSIRTLGNLFGAPPSESALCGMQTFLKIFGGTASFAWISVIAFIMYKLLSNPEKWDKFTLQRHKRVFHCCCWLFAFLNALIPVATGYYSNTVSWCFIDSSNIGILLRFFCYYLWCIMAWIVAVVLYFRIWRYMTQNKVDLWSLPTVSRLLYYPLIFFFCWFWSLFRRTYNVIDDGPDAPVAIIGLQVFFGNLYGFANAMLYGWIVRHHLRTTSQQITQASESREQVAFANVNDGMTNVETEVVSSDASDGDPEDETL